MKDKNPQILQPQQILISREKEREGREGGRIGIIKTEGAKTVCRQRETDHFKAVTV